MADGAIDTEAPPSFDDAPPPDFPPTQGQVDQARTSLQQVDPKAGPKLDLAGILSKVGIPPTFTYSATGAISRAFYGVEHAPEKLVQHFTNMKDYSRTQNQIEKLRIKQLNGDDSEETQKKIDEMKASQPQPDKTLAGLPQQLVSLPYFMASQTETHTEGIVLSLAAGLNTPYKWLAGLLGGPEAAKREEAGVAGMVQKIFPTTPPTATKAAIEAANPLVGMGKAMAITSDTVSASVYDGLLSYKDKNGQGVDKARAKLIARSVGAFTTALNDAAMVSLIPGLSTVLEGTFTDALLSLGANGTLSGLAGRVGALAVEQTAFALPQNVANALGDEMAKQYTNRAKGTQFENTPFWDLMGRIGFGTLEQGAIGAIVGTVTGAAGRGLRAIGGTLERRLGTVGESTAPIPPPESDPSLRPVPPDRPSVPSPDLVRPVEREAPLPDRTTVVNPIQKKGAIPFRAENVDVNAIKNHPDIFNFKEGANKQGVTEPLSGPIEKAGIGPIVLMEGNDGVLYIATGRNRLDLYRREGETTIPAHIFKESDGFTPQMARLFDAEANIRDEQGSVRDYANYFRQTGLSEEQASSRGLLSRTKGKNGFAIGAYASDELYAGYRNKAIGEERAAAIARGAPRDGVVQAEAMKALPSEVPLDQLENYTRGLLEQKQIGPAGGQTDLFGFDQSFAESLKKEARAASSMVNRLKDERAALQSALRIQGPERTQYLSQYGDISMDNAAIESRLGQLEESIQRMTGWQQDRELHNAVRQEAGLPPMEYTIAPQTVSAVETARQEELFAAQNEPLPVREPMILRDSGAKDVTEDPERYFDAKTIDHLRSLEGKDQNTFSGEDNRLIKDARDRSEFLKRTKGIIEVDGKPRDQQEVLNDLFNEMKRRAEISKAFHEGARTSKTSFLKNLKKGLKEPLLGIDLHDRDTFIRSLFEGGEFSLGFKLFENEPVQAESVYQALKPEYMSFPAGAFKDFGIDNPHKWLLQSEDVAGRNLERWAKLGMYMQTLHPDNMKHFEGDGFAFAEGDHAGIIDNLTSSEMADLKAKITPVEKRIVDRLLEGYRLQGGDISPVWKETRGTDFVKEDPYVPITVLPEGIDHFSFDQLVSVMDKNKVVQPSTASGHFITRLPEARGPVLVRNPFKEYGELADQAALFIAQEKNIRRMMKLYNDPKFQHQIEEGYGRTAVKSLLQHVKDIARTPLDIAKGLERPRGVFIASAISGSIHSAIRLMSLAIRSLFYTGFGPKGITQFMYGLAESVIRPGFVRQQDRIWSPYMRGGASGLPEFAEAERAGGTTTAGRFVDRVLAPLSKVTKMAYNAGNYAERNVMKTKALMEIRGKKLSPDVEDALRLAGIPTDKKSLARMSGQEQMVAAYKFADYGIVRTHASLVPEFQAIYRDANVLGYVLSPFTSEGSAMLNLVLRFVDDAKRRGAWTTVGRGMKWLAVLGTGIALDTTLKTAYSTAEGKKPEDKSFPEYWAENLPETAGRGVSELIPGGPAISYGVQQGIRASGRRRFTQGQPSEIIGMAQAPQNLLNISINVAKALSAKGYSAIRMAWAQAISDGVYIAGLAAGGFPTRTFESYYMIAANVINKMTNLNLPKSFQNVVEKILP